MFFEIIQTLMQTRLKDAGILQHVLQDGTGEISTYLLAHIIYSNRWILLPSEHISILFISTFNLGVTPLYSMEV